MIYSVIVLSLSMGLFALMSFLCTASNDLSGYSDLESTTGIQWCSSVESVALSSFQYVFQPNNFINSLFSLSLVTSGWPKAIAPVLSYFSHQTEWIIIVSCFHPYTWLGTPLLFLIYPFTLVLLAVFSVFRVFNNYLNINESQNIMMSKNLEFRQSWVQMLVSALTSVCPWASNLISLPFSSLPIKNESMIISTSIVS